MNTGLPPTLEESYILESRNNEIPHPLKKPSHMVIVDDCQGTDMYSLARRDLMNHVTIKHRHIPITICYLMQSWSGLPRVIRLNATHFIVYQMCDKKQLKQIYENFANTKAPKEESMRFRSGFNEFIGGK